MNSGEVNWTTKLVEKAGVPVINMFSKRIPLEDGSPLVETCNVCKNDGVACSRKSCVYRIDCKECSKGDDLLNDKFDRIEHPYIGETSQTVGMCALEHFENMDKLHSDSFMIAHWMQEHTLFFYKKPSLDISKNLRKS